MITPRPYQTVAAEHMVAFLRDAVPGARQMYAAPTGCGKSVIELMVQSAFTDCWIITPREEIIVGLLDKLGVQCRPDRTFGHRIATPIKLRNALAAGTLENPPKQLILDEGHHVSAESWEAIQLFAGMPPTIALTASPFRGTARGTKHLRDTWGEVTWILTFEEAARGGYVSVPQFSVLPLVDDDVVTIAANGEFDVLSLTAATVDRMGDLADHCRQYHDGERWDRPTLISVPSTAVVTRLCIEFGRRGMPVFPLTAETPRDERAAAFDGLVRGMFAIVHINVVSEGVDLPIRRLIDAAPTMSSVRWLQQVGRVTRPSDVAPEVVCCNRNILRHGHVFEGCMPSSAIAESADAFGSYGRSSASRALDLEAIGRFKPTSVKSASGVPVHLYNITSVRGAKSVEWACIVHPLYHEAVWSRREHGIKADGSRDYGKWTHAECPTDLVGFKSQPPAAVSDKQMAWWKRSAQGFGLDASQELDRKKFALLPIMADLKLIFRR